jgi:phosphoglycolate phosphatase
MVKLIIFDLDGTLLDISERYFRSVKSALREFGFKCPTKSKVIELKRQNLSGLQLIDTLIPKNVKNREKIKIKCNKLRYKLLHSKEFLIFDKPFLNTKKILRKIKNKKIKLALLTGRFYKKITIKQLKKLKLLKLFDFIIIDKSNTITSKCLFIKKICKKFNIPYSECYLVGDSLVEIEAGNLLNILTIGAAYGLSNKIVLSKKCHRIISDIKEVLKYI